MKNLERRGKKVFPYILISLNSLTESFFTYLILASMNQSLHTRQAKATTQADSGSAHNIVKVGIDNIFTLGAWRIKTYHAIDPAVTDACVGKNTGNCELPLQQRVTN